MTEEIEIKCNLAQKEGPKSLLNHCCCTCKSRVLITKDFSDYNMGYGCALFHDMAGEASVVTLSDDGYEHGICEGHEENE